MLSYGILIGIIITTLVLSVTNYCFHNFNINNIYKSNKFSNRKLNANNYKLTSNFNKASNQKAETIQSDLLVKQPNNLIKFVPKNNYILEIAILNDISAADSLKAKLALSGFEATIKITNNFPDKNSNCYKVILGPFKDKVNAVAIKDKLALSGFNNIIFKDLSGVPS